MSVTGLTLSTAAEGVALVVLEGSAWTTPPNRRRHTGPVPAVRSKRRRVAEAIPAAG